jgi:hypothetical protein
MSNNGNFENENKKNGFAGIKKVVRWNDKEIVATNPPLKKADRDFLDFLNTIEHLTVAENNLTGGQWNYLFAIMAELRKNHNINYYIYENPHGLLFDTSNHTMECIEGVRHKEKENELDKLKRLKQERARIKLNIRDMEKELQEIDREIEKLAVKILGEDFVITKKEAI